VLLALIVSIACLVRLYWWLVKSHKGLAQAFLLRPVKGLSVYTGVARRSASQRIAARRGVAMHRSQTTFERHLFDTIALPISPM